MATLKEMLAGLSNEELDALEQEFVKAQATGGNIAGGGGGMPVGGRGVLPTTSPAGRIGGVGGAALAGATAAGESVVRDVRSMAGFKPPERTTADELREFELKERMKNRLAGEDPIQRARLLLGEKRETRIEEEQGLRQKRFEIDNLFKVGGEVGDEEIKKSEETLTQDLSSQLDAGRGVPKVDKETGERKWRVLSEPEWTRKVTQGKFDSSEIEHLQTIRSENRAWRNVLDRLREMGIDTSTAGEVEFDVVNSPIGTLSIPARFNLAAQYAQDPRYTAVKRDIELAFQAFRKRVTGAQASDRELKMLRPIIASFKDRPEVFFQTVQNSIENTEIAFNDRLDVYKMAGRDVTQFEGLFPLREPTGARVGMAREPTGAPAGVTTSGKKFTIE